MLNEMMVGMGKKRSTIREIFEYARVRKAEIGAENVFDFSLGNPNVPAPAAVNDTIRELLAAHDDIYLHGYTSAQGDANTRRAIADNLNSRFGTEFGPDDLYMTCGAAASLKISITALYEPGDEFLTFTPFFPEYRVFTESAGASFKAVETDPATFQIDFDRLREALSEKTKGIIVNSPNNPSGVVFPEEAVVKLAALLEEKSAEYGHPIFLIADEPYRELVYDAKTKVPYLTEYYDNTLVCYSYSKSLSMPGERLGYILVSPKAKDAGDIYAAVCGAGRALGYVCAPSLMQHVIEKCTGMVADLSVYKTNRDLLYNSLTEYGYTCVYPDGAFYLFMKALEEDAEAFCEKAKKHELLLVPADSFGTPGYVRIAYCVTTEQIRKSLPAFKALAAEYA